MLLDKKKNKKTGYLELCEKICMDVRLMWIFSVHILENIGMTHIVPPFH